MPALLADAFPGVRNFLDASSFLFTGGVALPMELQLRVKPFYARPRAFFSPCLQLRAGIQGQWQDALEDLLYVVDGTDVHITRQCDGQSASIVLAEHSQKVGQHWNDFVWLQDTWYLDLPSVGKARETGELRWIPAAAWQNQGNHGKHHETSYQCSS
eukprot:Skav219122  [mRNA]  locus=scaffold1574:482350:484664:+ [translate_table: standard]